MMQKGHRQIIAWFAMTMMVMPTIAFGKEGEAHAPGISKIGDDHWIQRLTVSGLLEVEYSSGEDYAGVSSSDIALATVELAFDAKVNNEVNAHLSFLHEEDDTAYGVDEGYIDVAMGGFNIRAGQMYVPFGSYATNVLSDPVTLEVGEARESVVLLGAEMGGINASVYMFNGSTQETGADDGVDQMGFSIAYVSQGKGTKLDIGLDYINNIGDSDAVSAVVETNTGDVFLKSYVAAEVFHVNLTFGALHIIAEHLVTDQFDVTELPFGTKGAEITASNIEVGYDFLLSGKYTTLALSHQSTDEALGLGLPKEKMLLALSVELYKETALTFEYASSTDYDVADLGTGKDAVAYTVQLAVGF